MASTNPVAMFLMLALLGLCILSVVWLSMAYWQKRSHLNKLSKLSVLLSITPILSFVILYFGKAILSKFSVIVFFITPVLNIILIFTILFITILKVRNNKLISNRSSETTNP